MKHTSTWYEYQKLEALEREELIEAVKAHGGQYFFYDEETLNVDKVRATCPLISASTWWSDSYEDYYITKLYVTEKGTLEIYGFYKECILQEVELDNIATGHLGYITDEIPETESVKDVTKPTEDLPLLYITRSDLESVGYDPNIPQDLFQIIVSTVANDINDENIREAIDDACWYWDVPHLETGEEEAEG